MKEQIFSDLSLKIPYLIHKRIATLSTAVRIECPCSSLTVAGIMACLTKEEERGDLLQ